MKVVAEKSAATFVICVKSSHTINIVKYHILILLGLFVLGCAKQTDDEVLVTVNGQAITADYLRNVIRIQAKTAELSGHPIPQESFNRWGNEFARQILPNLVTATLWEQQIKRSGEDHEAEDESSILVRYGQNIGRSVKTPDELAQLYGELEAAFREQFFRSVRFATYTRRHLTPKISQRDIGDYYQFQTNLLASGKAIDAAARQKAEKAWQSLKAGMAWADVAKRYSEDRLIDESNESFAEDWAAVEADGFGYPELAKVLPTLKKGGFSRPVETEEGLMIVRLNGISGKHYDLARIIFRMAEPVTFPSPDEAEELVRQEKAEELQRNHVAQLHKGAKIDYCCGTNFNFVIFKD